MVGKIRELLKSYKIGFGPIALLKVAESQIFKFCLKSPKKGAKNYPTKEKMLRIVILHLFWEILANVKNFLRLSHLKNVTESSTTYN